MKTEIKYQRMCSISDCYKPARTRGWCVAHYTRFRHHGDPLGGRTFAGGIPRLTEEQVIEIRTRYAVGGINQQTLGFEYGVTQSNISSIITGQSWKTVPISEAASRRKGTTT